MNTWDEYSALEWDSCHHGVWPCHRCEDCEDEGHRQWFEANYPQQ